MILIGALSFGALAAAKGKLAGQVKDKSSDDPLPGVNISVEGTSMGAATDEDGFFYIINLPPGVYNVKVEMIGYATTMMENVQVSSNRTTTLNVQLQSQAVEGQTVVVEAERPVIQLDVSSSQRIVTEETIQERPLDNFEEILATEAGINLTASADGSGILVRGGGSMRPISWSTASPPATSATSSRSPTSA